MLIKVALISFVISVVVHALKGALDKLVGKVPTLQKVDDVVTKVEEIEDKVDEFLQKVAAPKA
jgi:ABC-type siderophore export system fused ATPase/permease subunit